MSDSKTDKRTAARPFGLLDMMIIVAAFGPVLLVLRDRYEFYRVPSTPAVYRTISAILALTNSLLIGLTLASTLISLRRPRACLRAALKRPGLAGCAAASAAIIVMMTRMSVKVYAMSTTAGPGRSFELRSVYHWLVSDHVRIGFAVLVAWLALLMTWGWRPDPSWVDRAGRVVGWGWLSLSLLHVLLPWIEPFLPAI